MTGELNIRAAALWYARHGIPVFACKPRGKEPLTPHGFKDATIDENQIKEWWDRWPDANIGIPTGAASGLLAVDVDPRNGGDDSLEALKRKYGAFPNTAEQETGSGGRHIVFRWLGGPVPKTLAQGIDLKADGGYIIAAPSIHPNGKRYQWDGIAGPKALLQLADPPAWLMELISVQTRNGVRTEDAADGAKWGPGERNNKLASIAGTMRRRGMSQEAIIAALIEENSRRCDPPLSESEVRSIAASVSRYEPAEGIPPRWSVRDIQSVWSLDARVSWIVPEIIGEGAVTLLTGDSGVGKSTLTLALCGAVARGEAFLGRHCLKRPVLYMDRENPLSVVKERLERLVIPATPDLIVWGGWIDPPTDDPAAPAVLKFVRDERPLIVFDSLVAFHTGSEQDASETRRHMQAYRNLASQGGTVLVLHHTGKSEGSHDYRGSSDIKAAMDGAWLLENTGDPGTGMQTLRLKPFKSRIALASPIRIEYSDGLFGENTENAETNREIIERIVSENPGENQGTLVKLAQTAGMAKNRAEQLLSEGERAGWLAVDIAKHGAKTYRPGLVEVQI